MNSAFRSKYAALLNEDWVKLGYQSEHAEHGLGLTNQVHPIFQRTQALRPRGAEHIWPQYKSEGEYDAMCAEMGTVFQLASKMLESPKSLEFLYQVAYSPRKVSNVGFGNQGRPCKEFGWTDPPFTGRQMVRNALRHLSRSLTFEIGDPEADPEVQGSFAVTAATLVHFGAGVAIDDVSRKTGMASRITLNGSWILKLKELDAQEGDTTSQKLSLQVKMAITLCHEIAHALAFAVNREYLEMSIRHYNAADQAHKEGRAYEYPVQELRTDEPYYRKETMAEIGNSWENQVFGGKINWSGNLSDPLFVSKWPSFLTSDDDYCPTRGKEKRTARKYVVSLHFIRNMHRQGFWDNVRSEHTNALYIKKTVGIEYGNPDTEAISVNSSEINWPHDEENSSRVSREKDGQTIPDPSDSRANETAEERRV